MALDLYTGGGTHGACPLIDRILQYFRSGHIVMTPSLSVRDLMATMSTSVPLQYPLQLDNNHHRHTFNGSAAIYQVLSDCQLDSGDKVLLPAYCCGAELGPFEALGCEMHFYDVNADASVNADQISEILSQQAGIKLVLITHYLGIAQRDIAAVAQVCKKHKRILLEDCAHALYCTIDDQPLGSFGDYAIFSPRKTLPLTEGGLVVARQAMDASGERQYRPPSWLPCFDRFSYSMLQGLRSAPVAGLNALLNKIAMGLWAIPVIGVKLIKVSRLLPDKAWLTPDIEGSTAAAIYDRSSSRLSQRILYTSNPQTIFEKRRRNYHHWVECVADCEHVRPLTKILPPGCCPLYFVVEVSDPAACVEALANCHIEAFNWWQHLPESIHWQHYPHAKHLKQSLVALPVHQGVSPAQVEYMAATLCALPSVRS